MTTNELGQYFEIVMNGLSTLFFFNYFTCWKFGES